MAKSRPSYEALKARVAELEAELTESLEQQTAMAEVLGIISREPTQVDHTLEALVERLAELTGVDEASLSRDLPGDENTVIVIEHHLDVIKTADYIIDLGQHGGDRGGELIAVGTPEEVALHPISFTGQYLRPILEAAGTLPESRASRATAASRNGSTSPEARAAAAAATIGTRIQRESAPQEPRPQTKAAAKRERQAAQPRKETASERGLREKRESKST